MENQLPHSRPEEAKKKSRKAKRVLILANPTATSFRFQNITEIVQCLEDAGMKVELKLTSRASEIAETCTDPDLSTDILAVAGGDASVSEAASALLGRGMKPHLAIIPLGTANVLAHELGVPSTPQEIAKTIIAGKTKKLHNGFANGRPFFLSTSTGFDAEVVHVVPLRLKRRYGRFAYLFIAAQLAFSRRKGSFKVRADDEELQCAMALITNGRYYAGKHLVVPDASILEKKLHLLVFKEDGVWALFKYACRLLTGSVAKSRNVECKAIRTARIDAYRAAAVQIDGEPFGGTPLEVSVGDCELTIISGK
ncbi:Diacylglycerol kinase [Pseudovibrio sp. Ad13]|uniref:diacylglycerol/lipid kinase family protein n=1 Tax=unclassified Pseudovibrio TaxID=2627060 RepID=UPI0007AE971D|nr:MULTISPECIES: YegS/Rv2252/BmrU family lipid kinase [unclassified Pseudovibrio]KZK85172.1 Diacylglycerol kinase [Pseudovibrio sp. Ad13]KZK94120.1 Diacylglycerol kinase [Pseudovibrio sp. W74]KZL10024.1 Diacylglycerol kinase [Pseudovibrio sp. Ad14]